MQLSRLAECRHENSLQRLTLRRPDIIDRGYGGAGNSINSTVTRAPLAGHIPRKEHRHVPQQRIRPGFQRPAAGSGQLGKRFNDRFRLVGDAFEVKAFPVVFSKPFTVNHVQCTSKPGYNIAVDLLRRCVEIPLSSTIRGQPLLIIIRYGAKDAKRSETLTCLLNHRTGHSI